MMPSRWFALCDGDLWMNRSCRFYSGSSECSRPANLVCEGDARFFEAADSIVRDVGVFVPIEMQDRATPQCPPTPDRQNDSTVTSRLMVGAG